MKILLKIQLLLIFIIATNSSNAIDLGSLDTSFSHDGVSDGWDLYSESSTENFVNKDAVVDDNGNIFIAQLYSGGDIIGNTVYRVQLIKYLPNGNIDNTFAGGGYMVMTAETIVGTKMKIEIDASNTNIYVGYTNNCGLIWDTVCNAKVVVYKINLGSEAVVAEKVFGRSAGSDSDRKNDWFSDMVYIATENKIAVTFESQNQLSTDTEFGIGMLHSSSLNLDTDYNSTGLSTCFFDHEIPAGSRDQPTSIVYDSFQSGKIIVAGSSFEGNGDNSNGWNMTFCEQDMDGSNQVKWSTKNAGVDSLNYEKVSSIALGNGNLYVGGVVRTVVNDNEFALIKYYRDIFGVWKKDNAEFSDNTTNLGWVLTGNVHQNPNTNIYNDFLTNIVAEKAGTILLVGSSTNNDTNETIISMIKYDSRGKLYKYWGDWLADYWSRTQFNTNGLIQIDEVSSVTQDPKTGAIFVVGHTTDYQPDDVTYREISYIAKLHNDGIFASGFE